MDTGKVYHDTDGNECSIIQMVQREPQWAANRIQEGEISKIERVVIEKALEWRIEWIDQEDLDEVESGCDCEICELIRACDALISLRKSIG